MKQTGCLLVSWDFSKGKDKAVVLVGERNLYNGRTDILHLFTGQEAYDIYNKLTRKEDYNESSGNV